MPSCSIFWWISSTHYLVPLVLSKPSGMFQHQLLGDKCFELTSDSHPTLLFLSGLLRFDILLKLALPATSGQQHKLSPGSIREGIFPYKLLSHAKFWTWKLILIDYRTRGLGISIQSQEGYLLQRKWLASSTQDLSCPACD